MRVFPFLVLLACFVAAASGIKCYVCNSLMNKDCEENFEKLQAFCPVKTFGGKKAVKAIGCRISRQYAKDEHSVVRECAYSGENAQSKSQKGSLGVGRYMTQCDENLCNFSSTPSLLLPVAAVLAFFRL